MTFTGILLSLEMSVQPDDELARQLQRRDPQAMARLYDRFGRMAWSVIRAIVRDDAIAEDLVQETFLRVWNRIHMFEAGKGALGPWLLAIARNRAIDHIRSVSAPMDRNAFELDVREHPSLLVDRERDVLNADHVRLIRSAVSRLSEKQQKVIELAYYDGFSQTGIAERLGEPLGSVKTWVRTALRHLREELAQAVTTPPAGSEADEKNCAELRDEYGAWALGIAEDPERQEIAAHLARHCPECSRGVSEALATAGLMAAAVKIQTPPRHLRERVLAMVDRKPAHGWIWSVLPWGVVGVLSVIILAIAVPAQRQNKDLGRLEDALSIVNDPATRDVTFGETAKQPRGRVFVSAAKGVVFIGANLPKLDTGKTFELWVIPATGKPVPAGTFDPRGDSGAMYVYNGAISGAAAITVTLEPEGGSPQPTTMPLIVTRL